MAYASHGMGYNTISVVDPLMPFIIAEGTSNDLFGWKQIVLNGSGLGVAAVSPNSTLDGSHHISLYDTTDASVIDSFVTEFETPGSAHAISIFNGLAYVADYEAGLQVINYLPFDADGFAPSLSFDVSPSLAGAIEEGSRALVDVEVSDDVQVRNVELRVDGELQGVHGNYPFQFFFTAPPRWAQSEVTISG